MLHIQQRSLNLWQTYFCASELPLVFSYTDQADPAWLLPAREKQHCLICDLARARKGHPLALDEGSVRSRI